MELFSARQMFSYEILEFGQKYTFSFDSGRFIQYRSDTWVLDHMRTDLESIAEILHVNRPFFSDHFQVTIIPLLRFTVNEWEKIFNNSWFRLGFEDAVMISVYGGLKSPDTGGISEGLVAPLSQGVADIAKPITTILITVAAGLVLYYLLPVRR